MHISFEPLEGAVDYRVYELPANADISLLEGGGVAIDNAVYRCAGNRQTPAITLEGAPPVKSGYMKTLVDGQDVNGYERSLADATLGHVYLESGKGRIPVHALGDSDPAAENEWYFMRWGASRVKEYVTSDAERILLLDRGFRDDGIAFYVPETPSPKTRSVFTSTDAKARYYFTEGAEAEVRSSPAPAFLVLNDAAPGTAPLMRTLHQRPARSPEPPTGGGSGVLEGCEPGAGARPRLVHWVWSGRCAGVFRRPAVRRC